MTSKLTSLSLVLVTSLLAVMPVRAGGKIYVGAKLAVADVDATGFDNAYLAGVYGGYNLLGKDSQFSQDLKGGTLAVEGEALLTARKGDAGAAGDWDMKSFGVFAAYRHPLTDYFYLKGKAGIVRTDIDTTTASAAAGTDTKLAFGAGAGWKVGPGNVEAELVTLEGDIITLSAGFHMSF